MSPTHRLLLDRIADVETIVVPNETQSLLLENNLIKEYQPRFNVRLKDDKSYPSIAVTLGEAFPRVLVTRRRDIPGARYFGPYTDVGEMRRTLNLIRRMFTVRSCTDDLPTSQRERPCLDYHIGRCKAPCVGWQDAPDYQHDDHRSARLPRGTHRRPQGAHPGTHARRERARRISSAPATFAMRSSGSIRWRAPTAVEVIGTGDADVDRLRARWR